MTPWQVLQTRGVARPVPGHFGPGRAGYHVHYGPGVLVQYSSKMVPVSTQKVILQELNMRLDFYLKQVNRLESANQKLEQKIQEELRKKCPSKCRELDTHLRTMSLLQSQITDCYSAQAEVKLHLVNAELDTTDLSFRCDQEREQRELLEAEVSDLRLMDAELNMHILPDLHSALTARSEELTQLQKQHQQDVQGLMTQLLGGITMETQNITPSEVMQQREEVMPSDSWFHAQVPMLTSADAACPNLSGSEVIHEELLGLRKTAASLEAELRRLQAHNVLLENTELEVRWGFDLKLDSLEQTADSLCTELVLQTVDQQDLHNTNNQMQAEIQDYRTLLDQLCNGVSSQLLSSTADVPPFHPALRRKVTPDKTFIIHGGNVTMRTNQSISGPIGPVPPAARVTPLPETQTIVKSNLVSSKQPENSSLTQADTSKLTYSIHNSTESQRSDEVKEREFMTASVTVDEWSRLVEDKVKNRECDHYNKSFGGTQFTQDLRKEAFIKPCQLKINTQTGFTRLDTINSAKAETTKPTTTTATKPASTDSETPPITKLSLTSESFISTHDRPEDDFQAIESGTNVKSMIEECLPGTELKLQDETRYVQNIHSTNNSEATDQEPGEVSKYDERTEVTDVVILTDKGGKVGYQEGNGQGKMEDASLVLRPEHSLSLLTIKDKKVMEDTAIVTETTSTNSELQNSMKPESNSFTKAILENDLQSNERERNITPLITEFLPQTEEKKKQETQFTPITCSINMNVNTETIHVSADMDKEGKIVTVEGSNQLKNKDKDPDFNCALVMSLEPEASDQLETYNTTLPEKLQRVRQTGINDQETEDNIHDDVDKDEQMQEVEKNKTVPGPESSQSQCGQTSDFNVEQPEETVPEAKEVSTSDVCISERNDINSEAILNEKEDTLKDRENETQRNKGTQEIAVRDVSPEPRSEDRLSLFKNKDYKAMEDRTTVSYFPPESSCTLNSEDNFLAQSEVLSPLILNKAEVSETEAEIKENEFKEQEHETKEEPEGTEERKDQSNDGAQVVITESEKEVDVQTVGQRDQEMLLSSTKASASLTDSSFELSSSNPEHLPSPREAGVFLSPTKPEICLSPLETTTLMNMTSKVFCPVEPEGNEPEDKVNIKDSHVYNTSTISTTVCHGSSEDSDITVSILQIDTPAGPIKDTDMETARSGGDESTKPKTPVIETTSRDSDLPNAMKPESNSSTNVVIEDDSQGNETERNIAPLITEFLPGTEAKMNHKTQVVDEGEQMQEVEKNKTVPGPESSQSQRGQTSDFNVEQPEETVPEVKEVSTSDVCISERNEVNSEAILNEKEDTVKDRENETQQNKGTQEIAVRDASPEPRSEDRLSLFKSKDYKVMEDRTTVSYFPPESSCTLNSEDNFLTQSEVLSPLILNKAEVSETEAEIKENEFKEQEHETKEEPEGEGTEERKDQTNDGAQVVITESEKEVDVQTVGQRDQEMLLSSTKASASLTDSSFELSSSNPEHLPSPREAGVFLSPTKPEICLSPLETTTLMNMTSKVFCPVEPEGNEPEDKVNIKDSHVYNTSTISTTVCHGSSEDSDITVSILQIDTPAGPIKDTDMETARSGGDESTKPKTPVIETTSRDSDLPNAMKPESNSSTNVVIEDDSQGNETERNIAPLITEFLPGTEAKINHETQVVDKGEQMQEVEKTKTVPEEAVPQAKEVFTSDVCISEGNEGAEEAILNENKDPVEDRENETQGKMGDQEVVVGDASPEQKLEDSLSLFKSKDNIVTEDTAPVSYLPSESSCPGNSGDNFLSESEVLSPLILKKAEVNETQAEIKENEHIKQEHETKEEYDREETEERKDWTNDAVKAITTESDHPEDLPIPRETGVFLSSTKPGICLSPLETTTLMNMTNQMFRPIEPEGNETHKVPSLDLCLSPNDSDTCLSPVEGQDFQTLNDEEDEEACLNLTEATTTVKPVEKFVLVTKASSLLNRDREVPEEDRAITEVKDKNQFCINAIRSNNGDNQNGLNIDWRPVSSGSGVQSRNHVQGGLSGGIVASHEEIPSKKEHSGFSGLYRESVRKGVNVRSFKDQYEDPGHPVHGKGILSAGGSPESNYKNLSIRDRTGTVGNAPGVQRNNDLSVAKMASNTKSGSFGGAPAAGTSSFGSVVSDAENKLTGVDSDSGIADSKPIMAGNTTGIFSGMAANSAGTVGSNVKTAATTRLTGRVRHGGREWIIYSGSPGRVSSLAGGTGNDETSSPSVAASAAENSSPALKRRSSSVESGELVTYSDRNSDFSLPSPGSKKTEATATTGLQGRIKYGSGEWNVYGGNLARRSSLPEGLSSPSTGRKEQIKPLVDTPPAKCPPAAGRFSSGDWAVYGSSPGHSRSPAGGFSTSSTGSEENVNTQAYTPQEKSAPAAGRFSSGDWAVYGSSPGHSRSPAGGFSTSSAGSEENVNTQAYTPQEKSAPAAGRFSSGDWAVYGSSPGHSRSPAGGFSTSSTGSEENVNTQAYTHQEKSAPAAGRFSSGDWAVYGSSPGHSRSPAGGFSTSSAGSEENVNTQVYTQQGKSIPAAGRFSSGGSGEWRVYSGSTGRVSSASSADRVSGNTSGTQVSAAPKSHRSSSIGSGSGGRLGPSSRSVVRRSSSVGSGGRLTSGGSHRISNSGTIVRSGSSEWKPVYNSAGEQRNSVGSDGGSVGIHRAPSPGERISGWLSNLVPSRKRVSPTSSSDRAAVRRISSASGSGRTTSTGGRVISSTDRPTRSTGSGAGAKKERISVCKMTARSFSAAGKEKSQKGQSSVLRSPQQQEIGTTPLVQHWLTTSVGVRSKNPDGFNDATRH